MAKRRPGRGFFQGDYYAEGVLSLEWQPMENGWRAEFLPTEEHQGFPGLVHGGVLAALLDEVLGRATHRPGIWWMTGRLTVAYRQAARVGEPLTITAWTARDRRRALEMAGEIRREDGTLIAEASGLFVRLPGRENPTPRPPPRRGEGES